MFSMPMSSMAFCPEKQNVVNQTPQFLVAIYTGGAVQPALPSMDFVECNLTR